MDATLLLLEQLIARASVTPDDAGCQALIAQRLEAAGFACEHLPFGPDGARVDNLWAVRTGPHPGPTLVLAGPWMLKQLVGYTHMLIESIPSLIG